MAGTIFSTTKAASPLAQGSQPSATARKLNADQAAVVRQLVNTDRHVRAHEQAHLVVAGAYATGGPSYTYAVGPDGQRYAVGGEVSLDTSSDPSNPEATVEKAKVIQAAANAPVDPSTQDRRVAAEAAQMEAAAEAQIFAQQRSGLGYSRKEAPELGQIIAAVA
ncbi:MAG TPA: putative metalloprotease CJM1_0395 family protein [Bryobacteraceae bacterium]|nr:putative metalloprotease CJM1_0395 family protein [Bryobacteraceae bacterium]